MFCLEFLFRPLQHRIMIIFLSKCKCAKTTNWQIFCMANMANDHKCQNIDISAVEDGHHRTVVVVLCHLNLVSYVCSTCLFLFED